VQVNKIDQRRHGLKAMSACLMSLKRLFAIGNVLEWYDFAVYGYFAAAIGRAFFPSEDPVAQVLAAFGIFAVGFLMRPIGGAVIGAGIGIGQIGGSAVEGMARQPEAAGKIQTAALILAALVEGAALFGVVIGFQIQGKITF
jgi:ATP synthase F0 subunit c